MKNCYVVEFDEHIGYEHGLRLQEQAFKIVKEKQLDGIILLLQHKPVYTTGSNGGIENLLASKSNLDTLEVEIIKTKRGGNITFHGPGQLVAYPILNLRSFKKDAHWYLRQLEEVVIQTLESYSIVGGRKPEYIGVWIGDKKITAIGVHMKRWITKHGFAFNLSVDKQWFDKINPCGITDFGVASLDDYLDEVNYHEVINKVKENFKSVFQMELISRDVDFLWGDENED